MRRHAVGSHSPEKRRRLSDLGHRLEGFLLLAVAILALLGNLGANWAATVWAILLVLAGASLLTLIYPLHPLGDWPIIWRDPQQRQHTIMAAAVTVAGIAELLRGDNVTLGFVWPAALLLIGALFLSHTQHGASEAMARAVRQHRILGVTIVLAGLLRAAEVTSGLLF